MISNAMFAYNGISSNTSFSYNVIIPMSRSNRTRISWRTSLSWHASNALNYPCNSHNFSNVLYPPQISRHPSHHHDIPHIHEVVSTRTHVAPKSIIPDLFSIHSNLRIPYIFLARSAVKKERELWNSHSPHPLPRIAGKYSQDFPSLHYSESLPYSTCSRFA